MTLKEKLERIWNRPGVIFPGNICLWNSLSGFYIDEGLFVRKGDARGKKPSKWKGFTYLCRNYGFYWRFQFRERSQ